MGIYGDKFEPMCETSEKGERLFTREALQTSSFDIGSRIVSLFGYQKLSHIVFRLRIHSRELADVIRGDKLPSAEMLLCIQQTTGASIDWILTGTGTQFLRREELIIRPPEKLSPPRQPKRTIQDHVQLP